MKSLPLNSLRAFNAVYSAGGVRAAARQLGVSHSSVSRHLAELERWLGVALTELKGRDLQFTMQGEELGQSLDIAFATMEGATARITEARTPASVVVSVTPSFASRWLLPRLPDFGKKHPKIELSVVVNQQPVLLEAGKTDIAIRMATTRPDNARCEPLMDEALYPVMSSDYWRQAGRPSKAEQLLGLRLLHDRDPGAAWAAWREAHGPADLDVRSGPRFTSSDLVLRAASQGLGVALARHRFVQSDIETGVLVRPIPDLAVSLGTSYWLLIPEHPHLPRTAVRAVLDWIKQAKKRCVVA